MQTGRSMAAQTKEQRRQTALDSLGLLDTAPEGEFDELVELAAQICGVPISMMSLVDRERVFHKAAYGMPNADVARQHSFCTHTILQDNIMVIANATLDERFRANPYVAPESGVRFYAGVPIRSQDGHNVGALCVVDLEPRRLDPQQERALEILARQIDMRMELRARAQSLLQTARQLLISSEGLRAFINALPVEAYMKDSSGHVLFCNDRMATRRGAAGQDLVGKTAFDLYPQDLAKQIDTEEKYILRTQKASEQYVEIPAANGANATYWKTIKVPVVQNDGAQALACIAIDMTEEMKREQRLQEMQDALENANRKLRTQSLTDELTGLRNRRAFDLRIAEEMGNAHRRKEPLALALLDIDNFKQLNDTFGHNYGDEALRRTAEVLQSMTRDGDVAFRYGGEEFALLMPDSDEQAAGVVCRRILQAMKMATWEKRLVSVSIGLAILVTGETAEELVHRADLAMYHAKRNGKACWIAYEAHMESESAAPPS